jgi:flagellin-like protein
MARHIMKSRKGISPVIATVILVAVAITVSVSVAYWMGGISSLYTRLEKIEVQSATAIKGVGGDYTITLAVKNTGSADATIDSVFINGKPLSQFGGNVTTNLATGGTAVVAGGSASVEAYVAAGAGAPFSAGTTIEVKLHTAAGKDYPQMVTLS